MKSLFPNNEPSSHVRHFRGGLDSTRYDKFGLCPDMIDSESGILVPPGDTSALADAMLLLARSPERRARMGEAARHRYQQLFSPQAVVPLMLETYGRVAARNGNGNRNGSTNGHNSHPWRSTHESYAPRANLNFPT